MYAYDIMMYIHVLYMITNVWYKEEYTKRIQTFNLNSSSLMFSWEIHMEKLTKKTDIKKPGNKIRDELR